MIKKKRFVEPELVKYEESLDKVTLNFKVYSTPAKVKKPKKVNNNT